MSLEENQRTVGVHLWDHGRARGYFHFISLMALIDSFEFRSSYQLSFDCNIVNVVPADFNRDGRLDMLVMCGSSTENSGLDMFLYLGMEGGFGMYCCCRLLRNASHR